MSCGQVCMYNTLRGCMVDEYGGECPMSNMGYKEQKPITNADRIRAMTDEELAELLADENHRMAKPVFDYFGYGIEKQIIYVRRLNWLQQPCGGADHA